MKKIFGLVFAVLLAFAALGVMHYSTAQEVEVSVGADTGRLFKDQALDLYQGPTGIFDGTVSFEDGWWASFWHAETGTRDANETDICAGREMSASENLVFDLNACWFEVAGKEVYQGEATFSYSLSEHLSLEGRADVMRGGFETEVGYLGLGYARDWFDAEVGVSYDTWSKDTTLQYGLGATYAFTSRTSIRGSISGFHVIDEGDPLQSDDEDATVAGVRLKHNFGATN